jgi:hypothetical protein
MAILKYIPPKKEIVDNRTSDGDYYVAICDVCGTEFYPKRASAKYCTPKCKQIQFRIDIAEGKEPKEIKKQPTIIENSGKLIVKGRLNVYKFLKTKYKTRGDREYILDALDNLWIGGIWGYENTLIERISALKFEVEI